MPEKSSPTGGYQPLARPVSDGALAKTVSGEQEEETTREEEAQPSEVASSEEQEFSHAEGEQEDKGLLDKIQDKLTGD